MNWKFTSKSGTVDDNSNPVMVNSHFLFDLESYQEIKLIASDKRQNNFFIDF